jgi:uncharacterized protein (DUF58 family)
VQVHPTGSAIHLAAAATVATLTGVALESGAIVAWSGAVLLGLGIARAVTEVSVARIRSSGFEMLWRGADRVQRIARGETIQIEAEVRNRDARAARYVGLRPVAAPELEVRVTPEHGEVPAGGRLRLDVSVTGLRVGLHAVHGLSLEVQGGPGLFEVPLTFANPFGIEVLPRAFARERQSAIGGRSRRDAEHGKSTPLSGESGELRELRHHQAGDPFRRIAWKASARRGELLVREYEREERDVVFLLIDAAGELSSGRPGEAALDRVLDDAATVALRHLGRGDPVGLGVIGRRVLAWIPPRRGLTHGMRLVETLARSVSPVHADRSGLDETDLALRVLEHMRPLDPELAGNVGFHELDRIARRADRLRAKAPFPHADVFAPSRRERMLRRYLEAFGLGSPLRITPDRAEVDELLTTALARLRAERPRPSLLFLWTPAPEPGTREKVVEAACRLRGRRSELVWATVPLDAGVDAKGASQIAAEVLSRRAELAASAGEARLRRLGIRVQRLGAEPPRPASASAAEPHTRLAMALSRHFGGSTT